MKPKRRRPFNAKGAAIRDAQKLGWFAHDVERHLGRGFITFDFLGFGDFMMWRPGPVPGFIEAKLVNATTEHNLKAHIESARASKRLKPEWLDLGLKAEIWAYPDREDREAGETGYRAVDVPNWPPFPVPGRGAPGKPGASD